MPLFLKRFLYFVFPVIILFGIIEILLLNSNFSYSVQKKQLESMSDSVEILILGPSYSYTGLNPGLFSYNAFNLSNNNQDIYYDFKLLEKYQPVLKKLKIVIFNIGYQTLDHELNSDSREGKKRESFYKNVFDIPRKNAKSFLVDYSYFLNMGFKRGIQHIIGETYKNIENGWYKNNDNNIFSETTDDPDKIVREKLLSANSINRDATERNTGYLHQAIELCERNRIKVLLCLDPVTSYYRHNINDLKYNFVIENLERIADGRNVFFLNLFSCSGFDDNDFSDMHHVNSAGSLKFSQALNAKTEEILKTEDAK